MLYGKERIIIDELFQRPIDTSEFETFRSECSKCRGLCCIALYFSKTDGFPEDKASGIPCKHLLTDCTCGIHSTLCKHGLRGCISYDCLGAGQKLCRHLAADFDWNTAGKAESEKICKVFLAVVQIQQILWYLKEALFLTAAFPMRNQIERLADEGEAISAKSPEALITYDITPFCSKAGELMKELSLRISYSTGARPGGKTSKDYMGKDLHGKRLAGTDFSMSYLIAANLEKADLCGANFLGADMRDANIKNTDLSQSLFLTQMQINSAKGNGRTKLPDYIGRPEGWD